MIKSFVFRINEKGFIDWIRSYWQIRIAINAYNTTTCEEFKEYIKPRYNEAKILYDEFLEFRKKCSSDELKFIDATINHKIPDKNLNFSFNNLFLRWKNEVVSKGHLTIDEISSERIGRAIKEAREFKCMTRKKVAEIICVNEHTLKAYENGLRKLPFEIYYKLSQFLDIDLF